MSFISDKTLFKAVSFTRSMIAKGKPPQDAVSISAKYYQISASSINSELAKGRKKKDHPKCHCGKDAQFTHWMGAANEPMSCWWIENYLCDSCKAEHESWSTRGMYKKIKHGAYK